MAERPAIFLFPGSSRMVGHIGRKKSRRRALAHLGFLFYALFFTAGASNALDYFTSLVLPEETWRFNDSGLDAGSAWREPAFDDSTWPAAQAPFGYGEDYVNTEVSYGPDPGNRYITTYLRKEFVFDGDPSLVTGLFLRANFDDGFVAYLNGSEIHRASMPEGTINYLTRALYHEGGAYEFIDISSQASLLRAGANLLAVEIHQQSASSSDLVGDFSLSFSEAPAAVIRGPYLQSTSTTATLLSWRTHRAVPTEVWCGTSPDALDLRFTNPAPVTDHSIELTGLETATIYYYALTLSGEILVGGDEAHFFHTAPLASQTTPTRIWVLGDSGTADESAARVRDAFLDYSGALAPDVWLMLGDNAYNDGTDTEYQSAVFDMYPSLLRTTPLWPTQGNHDDLHEGDHNDYFDIFSLPEDGEAGGVPSGSEEYFSFDYGIIHFICLNSEITDRTPGSPMWTWLTADLALNQSVWTIAFWHRPPYSDGSHNSDEPGAMTEMREFALPILEAAGVDLVLGGHSHAYERSCQLHGHYGFSTTLADSMVVNGGDGRTAGDGPYENPVGTGSPGGGTVYLVLGCSGFVEGGPLAHPVMVASSTALGSLIIDVDRTRLDARFLSDSGEVLDDFTILKTGSSSAPEFSQALTLFPNPGIGEVRLAVTWPTPEFAEIGVFDLRGQLVASLFRGQMETAEQMFSWDGTTSGGRPAASGHYVVRLKTGSRTVTAKFVFLR